MTLVCMVGTETAPKNSTGYLWRQSSSTASVGHRKFDSKSTTYDVSKDIQSFSASTQLLAFIFYNTE